MFYEPANASEAAFTFRFVVDQHIPPKFQLLAVFKFYIHYRLFVSERYHGNPLIPIFAALNHKGRVGLWVTRRLTNEPRFAYSDRLIELTLNEFSQFA